MAEPISLPPLSPEQIQNLSSTVVAAKIYIVTLFGILTWDTLATFPQEWKCVWKAKWTPLKVAFLINRYWTVTSTAVEVWMVTQGVSTSRCQKLARIQPGGVVLTVLACATILTIRVYALYQKNLHLLTVLISLMAVECITLAVATAQFQGIDISQFPGQAQLKGCVAATPSGHADGLLLAFWATPLAFDTVILGLTAYRVYQLRKQAGPLRILSTFLSDAGFYYSVILICDTINLAFYAQKNPVLRSINSPLSAIMTSLMASRIVLHLHASMSKPRPNLVAPMRPKSEMAMGVFASSSVRRPPRTLSPSRSFPSPFDPHSMAITVSQESNHSGHSVKLRRDGKEQMNQVYNEDWEVERKPSKKTMHCFRSFSVGSGIRVEREVVTVEDYEGGV